MNILTKNDSQTSTETARRRTVVPRYTVKEGVDAFTLTASVPGVDRPALEIHAEGENLTVFARRTWTPAKDATALYREIPDADYRLVLVLDHRINRDAVHAELKQGVLTLTLPKAEAVKPRKIEIQG